MSDPQLTAPRVRRERVSAPEAAPCFAAVSSGLLELAEMVEASLSFQTTALAVAEWISGLDTLLRFACKHTLRTPALDPPTAAPRKQLATNLQRIASTLRRWGSRRTYVKRCVVHAAVDHLTVTHLFISYSHFFNFENRVRCTQYGGWPLQTVL